MSSNVSGVQFFVAVALLGVVMFLIPPRAAPWLGLLLVLGALAVSGPGPIDDFRRRFLGG